MAGGGTHGVADHLSRDVGRLAAVEFSTARRERQGLNQFAGGWEVMSPAVDKIEGRRLSCPARSTNMKPTPATRLNWRVMVTAGRPHVDVAGPLGG